MYRSRCRPTGNLQYDCRKKTEYIEINKNRIQWFLWFSHPENRVWRMYCFVCNFGIRTVFIKTEYISQLVRSLTTDRAAACAGCPHWSSNGCVVCRYCMRRKSEKLLKIYESLIRCFGLSISARIFFKKWPAFSCRFAAAINVHSTHSTGHCMGLCHSCLAGVALKIVINRCESAQMVRKPKEACK